jgi:hypothetical protein
MFTRETIPDSSHARKSLKNELINLVSRAGLEPATTALKGRCSTIELPTRCQETEPESDAVL